MNHRQQAIYDVQEMLVTFHGIRADLNDVKYADSLDFYRFDYLTATRDDGSIVLLSWDGSNEYAITERHNRADLDEDSDRAWLVDLDTDTPAELFARIYYGE